MLALQRRKPYAPPTLGLNTRFSPGTLNDLEAEQLTNYQINNDGTLEKYPGYTLDGSPFPSSSDSFIRTLYNFRRGASVNQLLIAASDAGNANSTYKVDIKYTIGDGTYTYLTYGIGTAAFTHANTAVTGTNTSWTHELKAGDKIKLASDPDSDYTEIATVNNDTSITLVPGGYLGTTSGAAAYKARKIWNNGNIPAMVSFNNVAIIVDGNGVPQQYDGTNVFGLINSYSGTVITVQANPAPVGDYLAIHKNRVFMATQAGNLYWSHANDQTFWDPGSFEPIMPQDGGTIVAIKPFANSIFVFKNNGNVYRVFGNFDDSAIGTAADIQRVDYTEKIGIIASRSVFVHSNLLYFVAETGVYVIDQRGIMQKISYIIDPTTQQLNFGVSGSINKNFPFVTSAEWNTGTHAGTYTDPGDQKLHTFFDDFRITDALQQFNLCAVTIDSTNNVYVAYVPANNIQQINFIRYRVNGSTLGGTQIRKETNIVQTLNGNIIALSIRVSNVDGTVSIAYSTSSTNQLYHIERTPDIQSPFSYGTWGGVVTVDSFSSHVRCIYLTSQPGGDPELVLMQGNSTSVFRYYSRSGGIWTGSVVRGPTSSQSSELFYKVSLIRDNSNNLFAAVVGFVPNTDLYVGKSSNGGVSWAQYDDVHFSNQIDPRSDISMGFNHAGDTITVISDVNGNLLSRDNTTASTTTINTLANSWSGGWFPFYNTLNNINLNTDNYYLLSGSNPNTVEKIETNFNSGGMIGSSITNPTGNAVLENSTGQYRPSPGALQTNGRTLATVRFGTNANEIIVRRLAPYSNWTGPEQVDTSLTAWSTYVVTNPTSGANYEYQIALNSASPATSFVDINNGAIISNNPVNVYNKPRFIITLTGWGGVSITSLVLNYVGSGVDAKQLFGVSFYNEAYITGCINGQTSSNFQLIQDIKNAFLTAGYPVNCMEVFNQKLYGGSALQGDLYILKNGFNYNGTAYTATYISKEDFFDYVEVKKDFYKIYVLFNVQVGGTFTFSYRLDNFITGNAPWNTVTINQAQAGIQEVDIKQTGRSIQFRVQDNQLNQQSSVLGWVVAYGLLNLR